MVTSCKKTSMHKHRGSTTIVAWVVVVVCWCGRRWPGCCTNCGRCLLLLFFVVLFLFLFLLLYFSIRVSISCTGLLQKHDEKYWFHTPLMKRRKQIVNEWWHWFVDGSLWPIRSVIESFSNSAGNATTTAAAPTKKRRVTGKDLEDYQGYRLWVLDHQDQVCHHLGTFSHVWHVPVKVWCVQLYYRYHTGRSCIGIYRMSTARVVVLGTPMTGTGY